MMNHRRERGWFGVSKAGLEKLMAERGRAFIVYELLQNACDESVTRVDITISPVPDRPAFRLQVEDDAPEGFADLAHAYVLFAESAKKGDPSKRGRFNLGEKLVLAACESARIVTTKGGVAFEDDGDTRRRLRERRERGSLFDGIVKGTREQMEETMAAARRVIIPEDVTVAMNGEPLPKRAADHELEVALPTVVADAYGHLRRSRQKTTVRLYTPRPGEGAWIYELGIPVVETGDRWDVDVRQKVPLGKDRDNVPPAFLQEVRSAVLNEMHSVLGAGDATEPWVRAAAADPRCSTDAIRTIVTHRFSAKRVAFDPSDLEANNRAVAAGFTLVTGGSMSAGEWSNARRAGAVPPAGKVTPTPRPVAAGGPALEIVPAERWTPGMRAIASYAGQVARLVIQRDITIQVARNMGSGFDASYGHGVLTLNLGALGPQWFEGGITEAVDELLLHELAHEHEGNHLSDGFHVAICRLAARMIRLEREGSLPRDPGCGRHGMASPACPEVDLT